MWFFFSFFLDEKPNQTDSKPCISCGLHQVTGECTIKVASAASVFATDFYILFFFGTLLNFFGQETCNSFVVFQIHVRIPKCCFIFILFSTLNIKGEEWQKQQRRSDFGFCFAKGHTHTHTQWNII